MRSAGRTKTGSSLTGGEIMEQLALSMRIHKTQHFVVSETSVQYRHPYRFPFNSDQFQQNPERNAFIRF
jgi:hypothetical protein